jgi:hypothetical protein
MTGVIQWMGERLFEKHAQAGGDERTGITFVIGGSRGDDGGVDAAGGQQVFDTPVGVDRRPLILLQKRSDAVGDIGMSVDNRGQLTPGALAAMLLHVAGMKNADAADADDGDADR